MKKSRTRYQTAFKAKVALAAVSEQQTIAGLARRFSVHPNQIYKWRRELIAKAARAFESETKSGGGSPEREGELLQKIGELTVEPFSGSRKMRPTLAAEGHRINRKHVQRLMRKMGLEAMAPKLPATSDPAEEHVHYPYRMRRMKVTRVNQCWALDIERHEALSNRAVMKGHGRRSVVADGLKRRAA